MRAEADIPNVVHFSHRAPGKPLSDFVELFWYWTGHPQPLLRERILPMGSVELVIQLNAAPTVELKFRTLEQWLLGIATRPFQHHPAVTFAVNRFRKDPGFSSSADIAELVGFSQRRFIELFRNEVGMTPKLFCRVERFQHVIHSIGQKADVDWIDMALDHGYSDQSHFNHDFLEFSGLRPTEYLGLRTANHGHVRYSE